MCLHIFVAPVKYGTRRVTSKESELKTNHLRFCLLYGTAATAALGFCFMPLKLVE